MAEKSDSNGAGKQSSPEGGRDSRGRFTKNNPGGPGNPFARQTESASGGDDADHSGGTLAQCL